MSKILYMNNEDKFNDLHKIFSNSGFEKKVINKTKKNFFVAYKKLAIDNENSYVEYEDEKISFICTGVGTLFFDGSLCGVWGEGRTIKKIRTGL